MRERERKREIRENLGYWVKLKKIAIKNNQEKKSGYKKSILDSWL